MNKIDELKEYIEYFKKDEDFKNGEVIVEKTATYVAVFFKGLVKRIVVSLSEREATSEEWREFLEEVENFEKELEKVAVHVEEKDEGNTKIRKFFLSPPREEEREKKIAVIWYTADEYVFDHQLRTAKIRAFNNAEEMLSWMLEKYEKWVIDDPFLDEKEYLESKGYNREEYLLLRLILYNDYIE